MQASDDLAESLTMLYSLIGSREEDITIQSLLRYLLPSVTPIAEQAGIQLDLAVADELAASQERIRCNLILLAQSVGALVRHVVLLSGGNGRIQLSANLEDNQLMLQVQDESESIPAEDIDRIFEAGGSWSYLQTRDPALGGGGLDLHLVKLVIEQMDGKIWYEPNQGPGNLFCVSFPTVT